MLYSVTGRLTHKGIEAVHVQVGGVELELSISARSLQALPAAGAEVKIYTYLYHREDQMRLYGFASQAERALFLDLLRVGGVGPRLVTRILSGIDAAELVQALEANDLPRLVQIPGLGNKTAQKMVLTLQGKLSLAPAATAATGAAGLEDDITVALTGMGFGTREARAAVRAVIKELAAEGGGSEREQEVLRGAVARLSSLTAERTAAAAPGSRASG
jgi:Holliday junction DNA helicase RuvA